MKRFMALLLMATLIIMSSLTAFAANQGNGDTLRDRQRLQDQTCIVTAFNDQNGDCTQDMLRTRDMLKTRDRLRIMDHLRVQDQLRLQDHIFLHDGTCLKC